MPLKWFDLIWFEIWLHFHDFLVSNLIIIMTLIANFPKWENERPHQTADRHWHGPVSDLQITAGLQIISGDSAKVQYLYRLLVRPGSKWLERKTQARYWVSLLLLVTHSQNERQPPCRKRPGPRRGHWPYHTQEGTTQVQAKADPHI